MMNSTLLLGFDKKAQAVHEVPAANVMFLGGTGCGKFRLIAENIKHQEHANMVILDVRNRLFEETYETLESNGYYVMRYDFAASGSDSIGCYNPFAYMKSDEAIIEFVDIISDVIKDSPLEKSFVKCTLIDYLMNYRLEHDLSELTMHKLYDDVKSGAIKEFTENFLTDSMITEMLSDFQKYLEPYKDMDASKSPFDLTKLLIEEKQVLFLEMDMASTIPDLIYTILLNQLIKGVAGSKSNPELIFFLSEAGNLPVDAIPDFSKMLITARTHKTAFVLDVQSVGQLSNPILEAMTTIVFCGRPGLTDAEYLSGFCGIEEKHRLFCRPKLRKVMLVSEFQRLPADECAVLATGNKPLILKKLPLPNNRKNK